MQTPLVYTVSKGAPSIEVLGHWINRSIYEMGRSWLMTDADTCSLRILALKDAPTKEYKIYADQDTATFKSLWEAARNLEEDCLLSSNLPGWIPAGEYIVE